MNNPQDATFGHITAKSITLEGETHTIHIDATHGTPGIWISKDGKNPCVSIYMQGDTPVIGLYGKGAAACAAALSVDDRGDGLLQLTRQKAVEKTIVAHSRAGEVEVTT